MCNSYFEIVKAVNIICKIFLFLILYPIHITQTPFVSLYYQYETIYFAPSYHILHATLPLLHVVYCVEHLC